MPAPHTPSLTAPLRDRLAQLIFIRIGSNLPPVRTVEEDESRVAAILAEVPLGGLILFNGHYSATPATLTSLQSRSKYPLLVASDLERGVGQQLRGYPLLPHAMAFDALGDGAAAAVRSFAELTANAARAAGVHINFSPVADVNSDPRNPIISTRAFGTDPERVAELVAAYVEAAREHGLLAAAKHFPGHGDTHDDSHHALPTVDAPRETILQRETPPFLAAIEANVPLVMTAHVRYPSLDPTGTAATLSRPILTDLLRGELGFRGAVVSDSLLMEGVKVGCQGEGDLAVRALNAGVDILLDVADPVATLAALEAAVAEGRITEARVNEALARAAQLKELAFGADANKNFNEADNRNATEALALDVARRATVIPKFDDDILPLRPDHSLCAIFVNPFPLPSNADRPPLGDYLRQRFPNCTYEEVGATPTREQIDRLTKSALAADQILAAFVVKPAAWHRFGLPAPISEWLQSLAAQRPIVAACLGAPQGLEPLTSAAAHICTFSDVPASQQALVDALLHND